MSTDVVDTLVDLRRTAREKAKGRYLSLLAKPKLSDAELRELSELADRFGRIPGDVRQDLERMRQEALARAEAETIPAIQAELVDAKGRADALIEKLNAEREKIDAQESEANGTVDFLKHRLKIAQDAQRRLSDIGREWRRCFGEETPEPVLKTTHGGNPLVIEGF